MKIMINKENLAITEKYIAAIKQINIATNLKYRLTAIFSLNLHRNCIGTSIHLVFFVYPPEAAKIIDIICTFYTD